MLAFISAIDENSILDSFENVSFVHLNSSSDKDIEIEASPFCCAFARHHNLEKVYLFYGKDKKIIYDYTL